MRYEFYQATNRPSNTPTAHLAFYLRHEIPDLAFLYRLFSATGGDWIQQWVNDNPTGQYARRAAFLYEWLTGAELIPPNNLQGNYINALDNQKVVTASHHKISKNSRWRVNDNLAGTPFFCSTIIKNQSFENAEKLDIAVLLNQLNQEVGEDLLNRSATWFSLRESKATFQIEGEEKHTSRIERFANVIARHTGQGECPLTPQRLGELQEIILGENSALSHFGLRTSPVFIGETHQFAEMVHYIAPPADRLPERLNGLRVFWDKTQGQSPLMRCAVIIFGFVYLHPLADGNGRVHRFLLNDCLRRDGAIDKTTILPFSGVIAQSAEQRKQYAQILDTISAPLMQAMQGQFYFNQENTLYPDGVRSNLVIKDFQAAEPLWRYPNLTQHTAYIAQLSQSVIDDMYQESRYLHNHHTAREKIKEIIEMPNDYADRIIRAVRTNQGVLSNKLIKEFDFLKNNNELWQKIVQEVKSVFNDK